jgi:transposase
MVWKKKEKPLSPEEAIAQAKRELAPFWFNSEPLLAAIKTEAGASALPLTSDFVDRPWLFTFSPMVSPLSSA